MSALRSTQSLAALLAQQRRLKAAAGADAARGARLRELRAWQAARLERTYADLRREPRYARAVEFFLSDLYGPQEFADRDRDLARALRYLQRALPAAALDVLAQAIELEVLTAELDQAMVAVLTAGPITAGSYAAAYRAVGRRAARARQIELITDVGALLERVVRHAWIAPALRVAHAPAHAAGFGALQDFLERGFAAFRHMRGAGRFLQIIRERESCCMDTIYAGSDVPWGRAVEPAGRRM
jgi:hypothetical protein